MARFTEPLQQCEPAHSRQIGVDQQAGFGAGMKGFEKRLAARIIFDLPPVFLEHIANRCAYRGVVIDDEDDG